MSSTRALRLLNSVENGTTNSSQLENLLASTTGRLPELAVLFSVAGQASRITTNQKTVETLVSSQSALSVMVESGVMVNAIAQSPTARLAVKGAGASVLRRFLTSRHNDENVNSSWADDFAWTRQQLPSLGTASGVAETATWKALTFGNGKYVAIGYDTSAVAVSSDGVSWTLGQMPLTLKYTSAAYGGPGGNERFVAVADGTSTYVHSTDGLIWTAASLPKIANWQHVYFRAGKFTAVASNNTEVATSTDGLSWTIAASNNIFTQTKTVAGGAQGSAVTLALSGTGTATVPSGVTTLNVTGRGGAGSTQTVNLQGPGGAGATSLAFNNGTFVGTFTNSIVKYSTDGCATWTSCNIPNTHQYTHVYFVNNKFYVLTKNRSLIFSSSNGINFTSASLNITQNWLSIAFDGSRLIAVGAAADQNELDVNTNNAAYSTDGINWTTFTFPASRVYTSITYGNNKWVVVGWDRGGPAQSAIDNVYYSTDGGVNWTGATLPSNQGWRGVAYGNNCFLAIDGTGTYCAYSNDGVTWTQGIGFGSNKYKIQFWSKHSVFVITTDEGTFITTDGHSNRRIFSPGTSYDNYFGGLAITGDRAYVSNRINGKIYYSTDSQSFTNSETTQTLGANASVTVNGTAYTFNGSANVATPSSRTDTITLTGNAPVAFTYSCPAGTLVSATFIASDVQIAANGTGTATIPAGTSKLKITATGAAGSEAITIAIPNTNGDPAWEAVAYGAGRYVAIRGTGSTQNVATSTDGATWTKANLPGSTSGWTDITFGNGKFVAVRTSASDQLFAYSTDGITWSVVTPTALAPAAAGNWKKVAYGAGKFVAVGSGTSANVAYSTDGINWSTALIPGGLLWNGVTYGADRFVAVSFDAAANGANNIAYSTDGVTWTRTGLTGDSTARFTSIAFGGGKYLAVGNKQASSSDGVTWSVVGTAKNLTNVVYVLSQYVAFGAANGALAQYSADGVSWTNTSLGGGIVPSSGAFTIGAFGGSRFVIIASGDGQVAYSADARNFVTSTPQTTGANTVVTIAGVNYTFNGTTGANTPASRTDEVQLDINAPTSVTYNVANGASCVFAYSGGNSTQIINTPVTLLASAYNGSNKYVAVSYLENLVGYSADGVNWSVAIMPANVKWHGVSYGNGVFVAVAYDSSIAATSPDGSTWTQRAMPTSTKWGNVVYGAAGGHVALAEFSSINATTLDGITWTQRAMLELPSTSIEDGQITNVPLSGSGSVIIPSGTTSVTINGRGAAGTDEVTTPIYGPDGVTWTNNLGLPASQQYRAAYGGDKIVAIRVGAASTNAYYSSNGVTWTAATLPNADWASVVYGNGKFVAVAKGSATTAYSTDGVTWTTGNSGVSSGAFKVIYGNGKFVAVNQQTSNNLFYSTDGITWTAGSINSGSSAWTSVIFASGKFVAIGVAASANAAYSTDGVTWNVVNSHSLSSADSAGIAFGNGKFVGFITSSSTTSTVITTSTDGITWTNPTATGLGAGVGIQGADGVKSYGFIFVDGKFFIAARTTNVSNGIFQSTDGITWTASNGGTGDTHYWGDVVYTGTKLVAVGYSAVASVGISNNIIVGSQVVTPAVTGVGAAVNINSQSYTFTGSNTSTAPIARVETVSLNASAPTTVTYSAPAGTNVYLTYVALASSASPVTPLMPVQASWTEAAYGNGIFVAVATGSNIAATSPDGVNWTQQSLPVSTQWSHVSFSSGVFLAVSATGSIAATSPDGVTWTQRSLPQIATQGSGNSVSVALSNNTGGGLGVLPTNDGNWYDIAYGNGVTLAVAYSYSNGGVSGAVVSSNGYTFENSGLSLNGWQTTAYGAGKWVALGSNKIPAYSTNNGATWTNATYSGTRVHSSVIYANGRFVATCDGAAFITTSTDGVTWTDVSIGEANNWKAVAYGNGTFVVVGSAGNATYRSTNGTTWVAGTLPFSNASTAIFANGKFYVLSLSGGKLATSTDGITWTQSTVPDNVWTKLAYGNGVLVAIASSNSYASMYSTDGVNWTQIFDNNFNFRTVTYANGYFVALSYASNKVAYSVNGTSWSTTTPNTSGTVTVPAGISTISLTGQGAPGVAGTTVNATLTNNQGTSGTTTIPAGVTTLTVTGKGDAGVSIGGGETWTQYATPAGTYGTAIAFGGGKFVISAPYGYGVASSGNGISWSISNSGNPGTMKSITYGNGKFVGLNSYAASISYSTDGITWAQVGNPLTGAYKVTFGNGKFVMIGNTYSGGEYSTLTGNVVGYSTDGINWTSSTISSVAEWSSITHGNGKFVAIADKSNAVAYSTDGITWSTTTLPVIKRFPVITFGNGKFVFIGSSTNSGYDNVIYYSTDGITWVYVKDTIQRYIDITYGNGKFVAISGNYKVITSTDGINWIEGGELSSNSTNIVYGNGAFVALSAGTNQVSVSTDSVGTYGANTTFTINGTTYTFQGSGTETPPQLRTETITLSGSSSVNATYAVSSSGTLSLAYTPVTQGDPLVISVNGTNYTFAGSTTAGPATPRTETITGLGTGATTINYVMTPTKAATLAYTDAATTLSHAAWSATAYGNSTIVAVSSSGTHAAISADGTNWTKQVLPAGVGAADVVYGNNLFVAVGSSNKAATSSDGISWSQRPMPDNLNYKTVAFGNGKYVALASGGTSANVCAVSPDGITWESVSLPVIADWKSIAFKDGLFFAVAANTDQALTSPDGSIWTKRTLPATANWAAVTASDKKFVAIANGSTAALVSFDGAKFNMSSPGSGGLAGSSANSKWGLLSYGAGVFVAIAKNSTVAAISSDGITWTDRTLPSDTAWNAITYANGKFVVLAENTTTAAYSADGSVWNPTTLPVSQRWVSVAAGPRLFVAIAKDTSVYLTSKDGIAWTARNLPESGAWSAVRYGSGRYVITNDTTNKVLVSQDGITWTVNESASTGLNALAYGNGIFVGVASNDAGVDVSTDGYNWTQYGLPSISDWCAIRFGNGVFVALANNSAVVATSTDGVTWKQFNLPAAASWKAVAFGRGVFLGVSDSRTAVTNC